MNSFKSEPIQYFYRRGGKNAGELLATVYKETSGDRVSYRYDGKAGAGCGSDMGEVITRAHRASQHHEGKT